MHTVQKGQTESPPGKKPGVLESWQSRLLQLDKRNNLIYFNEKSKNSVKLKCFDLDQLYKSITDAGSKGLQFPYAKPILNSGQTVEVSGALSVLNCDLVELQRRLGVLRRRDREWEEEQGTNVLYVAFGMLDWIDESGNDAVAPIILLPADLNQTSPRDPYFLSREADDPVLNSTLSHCLSKLGWTLPSYDCEIPINDYLRRCENSLADSGFRIRKESLLACFAYSKLGMWTDIQGLRNSGARHPLINALLSPEVPSKAQRSQREQSELNLESTGGGQLDEVLLKRDRQLILPADYSQCLAAFHAQNGDHLIIHGPPGTGKSQTIANLIGMFLADGKSVLFVSEKTAALDVVKRRLDRCGLGTFCLDLHSDRGKRSEAYEQIAQALCFEPPTQRSFFPSNRYRNLLSKLNKVAQSLHVQRDPLRTSVFDVHGRLASLRSVPEADLQIVAQPYAVDQVTEDKLDLLLSICSKISNHPKEFSQHDNSFWDNVLRDNLSQLELNDRLQASASALLYAVDAFKESGEALAAVLDLSAPTTALELDRLVEIAKLILQSTWHKSYPMEWIGINACVRQLATEQSQLSNRLQKVRNSLGPIEEVLLSLQAEPDLISRLSDIQSKEHILKSALGENWTHIVARKGDAIRQSIVQLESKFDQAIVLLRDFAEYADETRTTQSDPSIEPDPVSLSSETLLKKIETIEEVLINTLSVGTQVHQFLPRSECQHLLSDLVVFRMLMRDYRENVLAMRETLDEARRLSGIQFHNWVHDGALLAWLTTTLQRLSSWALSTVSQQKSKNCLRLIRALSTESKQLRLAERELDRLANVEIAEHLDEDQIDHCLSVTVSRWRQLNPRYYWLKRVVGFTTNKHHSLTPEAIEAILRQARIVQRYRKQLAPIKAEFRLHVTHCDFEEASLQQLEAELVDLNALFQHERVDVSTLEKSLSDTGNASRIAGCQRKLAVLVKRVLTSYHQTLRILTERQLVARLADVRRRLTDIDIALEETIIPLQSVFPLLALVRNATQIKTLIDNFSEVKTIERQYMANNIMLRVQDSVHPSWDEAVLCIEWLEKLVSVCPEFSNSASLSRAIDEQTSLRDLITSIEQNRLLLVTKLGELRRLVHLPWLSSKDPSFVTVTNWLQELRKNAGGATEYLHYKVLVQTLDTMLQTNVVTQIRKVTDDAKLVGTVLEKFFLKKWLDWVYAATPLLREFDVKDHEKSIESFKELDKVKSPIAATEEIQRILVGNYPSEYAIYSKYGECAVIINEIKKQRRKLPIRQLIERAPNILKRIKPCFMMSPLAVSQYLPISHNEQFLFDVLIFDEASQIFPEDAIPAISRCKQVIVVGDEQQLPPTNFFNRTSDAAEDDDDNDESTIGGSESILSGIKQLSTVGVRECYLNMHYRSRDESLISFSNKNFYNNRLLTFPGPFRISATDGIRDCFVQGAVFDSGKTRRNQLEANKVVDLVFEHFEKYGFSRSLGVVALSRTQADFIHELILEKRKLTPDFDKYFSEDELEPFFVKNLENVQGDERDHIILSIGYGPPPDGGKVPNRFGPINTAGGERRLNVAVSRARYTMTLVRSLQPSDIRSERTGPQLLKQFISYCQLSSQGRQQQRIRNESEDDAFINVVRNALEERGYKVESFAQDCNKPLDLAILSDDGTGYDLGLIIDGKSYFSAPTARDREWLRPSVLEELGWKLVRLWSAVWLANPSAELDKLEDVISQARNLTLPTRTCANTVISAAEATPSNYSQILRERSDFEFSLFEPYSEASLAGCVSTSDRYLSSISDQTIHSMLSRLAIKEGPIHIDEALDRMREYLNVGRIGHKIRAQIISNLKYLRDTSKIRLMVDRDREPLFFWSTDLNTIAPRASTKGGNPRKIERIAPQELESGVLTVMHHLLVIDRDDLIKEVAKQFGYNRTGADILQAIRGAIRKLQKNGQLVELDNQVALTQK